MNRSDDPHQETRLHTENGMIYETNRRAQRGNGGAPPPANPKRTQSQFAMFYILTLFGGVIICIIIFAVVFNTILGRRNENQSAAAITPMPVQTAAGGQITEATGAVQSVNAASRSAVLLDVVSGEQYTVQITDATQMRDKYGDGIQLENFEEGDIVEVSFDISDDRAKSMSKSAQAWVRPSRKDVQVDAAKRTVTVGNEVYTYNGNLMALYRGAPFDPSQIASIDTVSLSGIDNQVWVVTLDKSHGYIRLRNQEFIENGEYTLDTSQYSQDLQIDPITVLEGPHTIVVTGDNIDLFVENVEVTAGGYADVDLNQAQIKSGILNFMVNQTEYTLWIDGTEVSRHEPAVLPYGDHVIRAEKEEFVSDEKTVNVHQPSTSVSLTLKETRKMGRVIITTSPAEADVYIDDALIGKSPVSVSMDLGDYVLRVEKEGYETMSLPVTVDKENEPYNPYHVELKPSSSLQWPPMREPWPSASAEPSVPASAEPSVSAAAEPSVSGLEWEWPLSFFDMYPTEEILP
ncbi:MAG: PEGA domain-containing protein [Clostridiales bacterium]|jgi:hypothetical protein|nr:PEGA domain-containing protein [Clostridiales bacterium]